MPGDEISLDFSGVQDTEVTEGWHTARIFSLEKAASSNGNAMLKVQSKIEGGPFNGRSLFDNWMLETDALFRTKQTLVRLGKMSKDDKAVKITPSDFLGMEVEIRVKHEEYEGEMRPRVKGWRLPTGNTIETTTA